MELIKSVFVSLRIKDFVDFIFVYIIVYNILLLIRGTRAVQMLTGLAVMVVAYFIALEAELYALHWLFNSFFDYLIIVVIILFQDEIRRWLATIGRNPFVSTPQGEQESWIVDEMVKAVERLSLERTGALIVIERETGLKDYIDVGTTLLAKVNSDLIHSIFQKSSSIHDGAIIIQKGWIISARCFLPFTKNTNIQRLYGTRHQAAIGLSEETDAVVIIVSGLTGEISIALNRGKLSRNLDRESLQKILINVFQSRKIEVSLESVSR